jgi:hypothetical protein
MLDLREMMALLDEAISFGDELRAKLHDWAVKLHTRDNPNLTDDDELKSVLLWVKSLVMVSWDISGSVFVLASGDNLRAIKILNRCMFEYWVRIFYYVWNRDEAVAHAKLVNPTNRKGIRANRDWFDRSVMTPEEIAYLDSVLSSNDESVPIPKFRNILKAVVKQLKLDDWEAAEKWMYENYYLIASGFVHGSPALLLDMYLYPDEHTVGMLDKSDRQHPIEGVGECISHLLWTLKALSLAIGRDEYAMYQRFYELKFDGAIKAEALCLNAERAERRKRDREAGNSQF